MTQVTDREVLQELANKPIGGPGCKAEFVKGEWKVNAEAKEAHERACKIWLPAGKRSTSGAEARASREALYERQIDLEDAIEAAGGQRGSRSA